MSSGEQSWEFGHQLKHVFHLDPSCCALVIVDMQYASASRNHGVGRYLAQAGRGHLFKWRFDRLEQIVLPNLVRLLAFFRASGLPVLHLAIGSEMDDYSDMPAFLRPFAQAAGNRVGQPANGFLDELAPRVGERIVRKTTVSAFNSSSIDAVLRSMEIRQLCFTGVSTDSCVDGTARDAADLSYECVLVEDCCSATREDHHLAAMSSFASQSGRVMTAAEVELELAGSPGAHRAAA